MKYIVICGNTETKHSSLESARKALSLAVRENIRTKQLMGKPISVPHWPICDEFYNPIEYADDDNFDSIE